MCIRDRPDAWGWAAGAVKQFSPNRLLRGLDELRTEHLPTRLDSAAKLHFERDDWADRIHARSVLAALGKALKEIDQNSLSDGLLKFLQTTFGSRKFVEGREGDTADLEAAKAFMERLSDWMPPWTRPIMAARMYISTCESMKNAKIVTPT